MKWLSTYNHQHDRNSNYYHLWKGHCTYIWVRGNTSLGHIRMALNPKLRIPSTSPGSFIPRMAIALISDQVGTHPSITSEWPCAHIWSCRNTSYSHIRMALSLRLSIPSNWLGSSILPENGIRTYIWSSGNTSLNHIRMAMCSHMIM